MTSIDKLLIQGIRSFSPQNRNVIEFFKPLTLIVGTNGAGKTTIIECLKYACTGELPPNSRNGQAFIHDTKVAREREVKAQIKMLFKAVTGKCIVATRSLQLTQKANAQQCKTIESALKTYNASGDKVSQSYRCSDIDKQVPELMGVSKAVLENVIFCHQEDSNWPLDEPASLKKKFDDIFASTRYTMALEVIKKQQKQNNQMIKELRLKLQTAQVQLDHVHKLQKQLQDSRATITRGNEKMAQYDQSISGMDAEIASRKAKVDECHRLRTGIQPQLDALRQHEAQATALRADLGGEEISDADEQLVATLAHLQSEEEANAAEIARLKQLMTDQQQEKLLLAQRMQLTLEQSQRIRQTVEENAKKADARDRLVIELALRYEIAGYTVAALPLSHETAQKFVDELKTQLQAMRAHVTQLKDRHSADLRKITEQVELLQRNRGQIQERLAQQLARQEETEKRAAAMKAELTTLEAANTDVRQLESQVAEAEAALASTQAMFADDPTPAQIAEAENEQQQIRIQMNELSNALKHLNKQTEARSAVNLRRRNCEEKDLRYQSRLATLRPELERLLGSAPAPDALSAAWKSFAATKKQALASAIAALQEARTSASEIDGELKSVSETLKKLTTSLEEKREKLAARLQAAGIDALPDAINLNEKAIAQLKKDLNWAASLKSTYSRFEKDAQDAKECPLCHRGFGDDAELGKFRTHIHDRVANFPAALEAQRQELAEKEKLQKVLLSLRHDSEDIERMKEEAAVLQHKSQELTKSRDGRREHLASLQSAVDEAKAEEQEVAKHTTEVDLLLRDHADLQKARKELDAEETQLRKLSSDTRTIEEVSQKYQQLQTTADALVNRISELRGNREALAMELKAAQDVCHALRTRLFQAQSNIETMRRLRTAIDEGTAALAFLQTDVPLARRALAEIDTELAALEARRKEMDAAANRLSTEATARHDALFADVQQLEGVVRALATAVPAAAKELETLEKNRTQAELRTDELTKSLQASASAIEARTSKSGARQVLLRRLQATLQFRKVKAAIAELTRKIEAEVAHIGTVDVEKLTSELAAMEKTLQKKREKRAEASGAIAAVAARIREHEAELAQAHLKHAEEEHRTLTVQCKTTEMATKDLDGYYHALDKALMRYHTAKIDEINKIVKELWQQTYRGQDIDAIEIHADQGDATKTRSYNYRIVMRKGDTELDMRGRCSAGQKVLASLVLRLALAETFGLNCGILALDEPTTNLDRANVESFANALITIIEQRRHQANFQLIVITHDEEFVEKLGSDEHASHYWRVTKDANQHSLLEQRDIKDLSKK